LDTLEQVRWVNIAEFFNWAIPEKKKKKGNCPGKLVEGERGDKTLPSIKGV